MRTHTVSMRLVMALLGNAVLLGLSVGGLALAADPDFSTVSDILGGRRSLLRIDDMVVVEVDRGAATTATSDQYLVFWVVVWIEDAQGVLVPELPDHGLTDNQSGLSFAQVTDVPVEAFSNNVGLYGYKTPFYVAPPNRELVSPASTGVPTIGSVLISPSVLLDQRAKVQAHLLTGAEPSGATLVAFYDGDPRQSGRAFDVLHIAALRADDTYQSQVFYRPQSCGEHTVYVVAGPATPTPATATATVQVTSSRYHW